MAPNPPTKMTDEARIGFLLACIDSKEDFKPDMKVVADKVGIKFDAARKRLPAIRADYEKRVGAAGSPASGSGSGSGNAASGIAGVTPTPTPSADGADEEEGDNVEEATPSKKRKAAGGTPKKATTTPKKAAATPKAPKTPKTTPKAKAEKTPRKTASAKKGKAALSAETVKEEDDEEAGEEEEGATTPKASGSGDEDEILDPVTPTKTSASASKASADEDDDLNAAASDDDENEEPTPKKRKNFNAGATPVKTPTKPKKERTPAEEAKLQKRRQAYAAKKGKIQTGQAGGEVSGDGEPNLGMDVDGVANEEAKPKTPAKQPRATRTPKSKDAKAGLSKTGGAAAGSDGNDEGVDVKAESNGGNEEGASAQGGQDSVDGTANLPIHDAAPSTTAKDAPKTDDSANKMEVEDSADDDSKDDGDVSGSPLGTFGAKDSFADVF